jgi:hypothetical protein
LGGIARQVVQGRKRDASPKNPAKDVLGTSATPHHRRRLIQRPTALGRCLFGFFEPIFSLQKQTGPYLKVLNTRQ